ncbi:ABC transporter ATP-binding protein [Halolamina litorea]|uniref:ABC transporter ATP-binding protein n=1 Tax=Halolamina litorea TaxID=1515593 RepID=A0ABD6BSV0_9EURY|nr:ABC transporter ATP-binding protein [Halolamina litorea]
MTLLEVNDLHVTYSGDPDVEAVRGVSFTLEEGETLGIVGESGCGKTTLAQAIMGALPDNGEITGGEIIFDGEDITHLSNRERREIRWERMSMISQSAMNSLDPVYRVKDQIKEAIQEHRDMSDSASYERARELMELVGLDPDRVEDYPHQLSGGMRQRVIIAMSLALDPDLIIADEPTTALDVIIQEQILYRIKELQRELGNSMVMVTHDISVVAETCDSMVVMYGGELMEYGGVDEIFNEAQHPYTLGLQNAFPSVEGEKRDLTSIPGSPPDLSEPPGGCPFASRCPFSAPECEQPLPTVEAGENHQVRCHEPIPFEQIRNRSTEDETWLSPNQH